jgi:sec-independent protein translocase protein TatC
MTLLEHLKEFQVRLFRAVIAIAIGSAVAYFFYQPIFAAIRRPFDDVVNQARADGKTVELVISGVTDAFTLQLQIVLVSGLILSAPFWLYQLWRFLAPGLNSNERRWAYGFALAATPLFLLGCAVAYVAMPNLLAGEALFPEFVQSDATAEKVGREALNLLLDTERRVRIRSGLERVMASLGGPGACGRAAEAVARLLR